MYLFYFDAMKLLVAAIFAFLAVSAFAEDNWDIDFSTVVPVVDLPGFWDGRDAFKPLVSNDFNRDRRIVGGIIVTPNSHPYQAGLLMAFGTGTGLCGGSIISPRNVLTAAHCRKLKISFYMNSSLKVFQLDYSARIFQHSSHSRSSPNHNC